MVDERAAVDYKHPSRLREGQHHSRAHPNKLGGKATTNPLQSLTKPATACSDGFLQLRSSPHFTSLDVLPSAKWAVANADAPFH